ncbi:MAG: hypothetical protein SGILL_006554 [Bacillariaceae sp.]
MGNSASNQQSKKERPPEEVAAAAASASRPGSRSNNASSQIRVAGTKRPPEEDAESKTVSSPTHTSKTERRRPARKKREESKSAYSPRRKYAAAQATRRKLPVEETSVPKRTQQGGQVAYYKNMLASKVEENVELRRQIASKDEENDSLRNQLEEALWANSTTESVTAPPTSTTLSYPRSSQTSQQKPIQRRSNRIKKKQPVEEVIDRATAPSTLTATTPPNRGSPQTSQQNHPNEAVSDRARLAQALQKETAVRLEKLKYREGGDNNNAHSTTLKSEHLVQVYPSTKALPSTPFQNRLERDRFYYQNQKSCASLRELQTSDNSLTPILVEGYERSENIQKSDFLIPFVSPSLSRFPTTCYKQVAPVPPNMVFFEIVLEAFMGYSLHGLYNSSRWAMPRAAVMGGAVVAALTSWRSRDIINAFSDSMIEAELQNPSADEKSYNETRSKLVTKLNLKFSHSQPDRLAFSNGDVDVFLQASPFTRELLRVFSRLGGGVPATVIDHISSFTGGCGIAGGDLQRFAGAATKRIPINDKYGDELVFALTDRCLSFMMACDEGFPDNKSWPRTSQFIMLHPYADLEGALMDFDNAICSCSYDGVGVQATERAEYALQTMTSVVTPFCLQEKRNRKRIVKYFKRGFNPALLDPNCFHDNHCNQENCRIVNLDEEEKKILCSGGPYECRSLRGDKYDNVVDEIQQARSNNIPDDRGWLLGTSRRDPNNFCCCRDPSGGSSYSFVLFEKTKGHAMEYFARRGYWDNEMRERVMATMPEERMACKRCRQEYGLCLFLEGESKVRFVDDVLCGEKCLKMGPGEKGTLSPSFYGGGVFAASIVRDDCLDRNTVRMRLRGQSLAEHCRYILKHGNADGFQARFLHDDDDFVFTEGFQRKTRHRLYDRSLPLVLERIFKKASEHQFPGASRPPIGLNPERFIGECKSCKQWLHGCEFGTEYCSECQNSKPAAK